MKTLARNTSGWRTLAVCAAFAGASASASAQSQDVTVTNPPGNAVNVAPIADTLPFIASREIAGTPGGYRTAVASFTGTIPQGYRLIVDHVSIFGRVPAGQRIWATTRLPNAVNPNDPFGNSGIVTLPVSYQGTDFEASPIHDVLAGNAAVHFAVDFGMTFEVRIGYSRKFGNQNVVVTVEGHLVPAPPPRQ